MGIITILTSIQCPAMSLPVSVFGAVTLFCLFTSFAGASLQFDNVTYYAEVLENQTVIQAVVRVTATDPDDPDATISYTLDASTISDNFLINTTTGEVITSPSFSLDREMTDAVNITVLASSNNLTATAFIEVTVLDIDDNKPIFSVTNFRVEFPQNFQRDQTRQLPTATDRDSPEYNQITYSDVGLKSQTWGEYFEITQETAEMRVKKRCDTSCNSPSDIEFEFTLIAIGHAGSIDDMMIVTVVLKYDDPNRHAPKFEKDTYALRVRNDTKAVGQVLLTTIAYDNDTGRDGTISYTISPSTSDRTRSIFRVDEKTGNITFQQKFDTDVDMYKFTVVATDAGEKRKSGTTEVVIFVRSVIPITDTSTVSIVAGCLSAVVLIVVAFAVFLVIRYRALQTKLENEKQEKEQLKRLHGLFEKEYNRGRPRPNGEEVYDQPDDPREDYEQPPEDYEAPLETYQRIPERRSGSPPPWDPTQVPDVPRRNGDLPNHLSLPGGHERAESTGSYIVPKSASGPNPDYITPTSLTKGAALPSQFTSTNNVPQNSDRWSAAGGARL